MTEGGDDEISSCPSSCSQDSQPLLEPMEDPRSTNVSISPIDDSSSHGKKSSQSTTDFRFMNDQKTFMRKPGRPKKSERDDEDINLTSEIYENMDFIVTYGKEVQTVSKKLDSLLSEKNDKANGRIHVEDFKVYNDISFTSSEHAKYEIRTWPNDNSTKRKRKIKKSQNRDVEWEEVYSDTIDKDDFARKYLTKQMEEPFFSFKRSQSDKIPDVLDDLIQKCWERAVHAASNLILIDPDAERKKQIDTSPKQGATVCQNLEIKFEPKQDKDEYGNSNFYCLCGERFPSFDEASKHFYGSNIRRGCCWSKIKQKRCEVIRSIMRKETLSIIDNYLHLLSPRISATKNLTRSGPIDYKQFLRHIKDDAALNLGSQTTSESTNVIETIDIHSKITPLVLNDEVFISLTSQLSDRYHIPRGLEQRQIVKKRRKG